jgi:hypothetical protein
VNQKAHKAENFWSFTSLYAQSNSSNRSFERDLVLAG